MNEENSNDLQASINEDSDAFIDIYRTDPQAAFENLVARTQALTPERYPQMVDLRPPTRRSHRATELKWADEDEAAPVYTADASTSHSSISVYSDESAPRQPLRHITRRLTSDGCRPRLDMRRANSMPPRVQAPGYASRSAPAYEEVDSSEGGKKTGRKRAFMRGLGIKLVGKIKSLGKNIVPSKGKEPENTV